MNNGLHNRVMPEAPKNGIIGRVKIKRFLRSTVEATAFRLGPRIFAMHEGKLLGIIADPTPVAGGTYSLSWTKPSGPLKDSAIEAFRRFKQMTAGQEQVEGPYH
ncbi:MAG: hypothetical protein ABID61_02820 [Candidatus Micrarchaeota archaeon]